MSQRLTFEQARSLRLCAQGLLRERDAPPAAPAEPVRKMVGVQAQELQAGLLSIRARCPGLTVTQVEAARQAGGLVWTWAMRGTLHLVAAQDAGWLVALLGPGLIAGAQRRMKQLGWDEEHTAAGLRAAADILAQTGVFTRPELAARLKERGLPHEGQAAYHLIYRAALEGLLVRGGLRGKEVAYIRFAGGAEPLERLPRQEALARLAQRYLEAYAPAGPKDLAAWAGIRAAEAQAAWQACAAQLAPVEVNGETLWLLKRQLDWLDEPLPNRQVARLLPRFDTLHLGYAARFLDIQPEHARRVYPGGGIIHAALLSGARLSGTWRIRAGKAPELQVEPFEPLPEALRPALDAEADDMSRFLEKDLRLVILP